MVDSSFLSAINLLPKDLHNNLLNIDENISKQVTEIRLRSGKPLSLTLRDKIVFLSYDGYSLMVNNRTFITTQEIVTESFLQLCNHSVYSHEEELAEGYLILKDGHRAGICGRAMNKKDGSPWIAEVNSINIRIARELTGIADNVYRETRGFKGLLICGAPNTGKTTLLRDFSRIASDNGEKVTVVDCRGEIAAVKNGLCGLNVGVNTDVITGGCKSEGIQRALRVLSPNIITFDEIGSEDELQSIQDSLNSGVKIITTFHCENIDELRDRNKYLHILDSNVFSHFIFLDKFRKTSVYKRGEIIYENSGHSCVDNLNYNLRNDFICKT